MPVKRWILQGTILRPSRLESGCSNQLSLFDESLDKQTLPFDSTVTAAILCNMVRKKELPIQKP